MKKILTLLVAMGLVLSLSTSALACNDCNDCDDVFDYGDSYVQVEKIEKNASRYETGDLVASYTFRNQTRANCYDCGRPTLYLYTRLDEIFLRSAACGESMTNVDFVLAVYEYSWRECSSCGIEEDESLEDRYWAIQCNNGEESGEMMNGLFIIDWMCQCYSAHCHVDPLDPGEYVWDTYGPDQPPLDPDDLVDLYELY